MKKFIPYFFVTLIAALVVISMTSTRKKEYAVPVINRATEKGFVLMELFTSQGCSSCPPADEILGNYARRNDEHIIPLAFHVDYWNRLGWIDSFSNSKYTQRQQQYAAKFNLESTYTPQLILNGQKELVGSDENSIANIVNDFLKGNAAVKISVATPAIASNKITVPYSLDRILPNSYINAVLVQDNVITTIRAGENKGVKLTNYNVVRDFKTMRLSETVGKFTLLLPQGNSAAGFSIVLFVQDVDSGKITGAVKTKL